jgi:hypothetical protein
LSAIKTSKRRRGRPERPGDRRVAVEQVERAADVGDVRAAGQHVDRGAVTVADQVVLGARLTAVDRRRTGSGAPLFSVDVTTVHRRSRPVDPVRRVQLGEQYLMHLVEDSCLGPAFEAPPTGHTGAEAEFLRQVFPTDPGVQHQQDALQA